MGSQGGEINAGLGVDFHDGQTRVGDNKSPVYKVIAVKHIQHAIFSLRFLECIHEERTTHTL